MKFLRWFLNETLAYEKNDLEYTRKKKMLQKYEEKKNLLTFSLTTSREKSTK